MVSSDRHKDSDCSSKAHMLTTSTSGEATAPPSLLFYYYFYYYYYDTLRVVAGIFKQNFKMK
jgi:hypothetical protein